MYFLTFLDLKTGDTKALFILLQPPMEGSGEVVFGEFTDDPLPRVLELPLGPGDDRHLSFQNKYKEEVCRSQVRTGGGARGDLCGLFGQKQLDLVGVVDWKLGGPSC